MSSPFDDLFRILESDMRNRFRDPHEEPEPEISDDRLIQMGPLDMCLIFKQCRHHIHVPSYIFNSMKTNREKVLYINGIKCPDCKREIRDMEESLRQQHIAFEKRGKL